MGDAEPSRLILASGSASRRRLLEAAGAAFDVRPADVDERAIARAIADGPAYEEPLGLAQAVARTLARAKALDVSARRPADLVIGADQTLALLIEDGAGRVGRSLDKPDDIAAARRQLVQMRGKTHVLCSAVALARGGEVVWEVEDRAELTMRHFSDAFLDDYLVRAGESVCSSVGAYQLEGLGLQLFERIKGDYFTILGLPLLPLMGELRRVGILDA